jgi:uncharacterized protein
MQYRKFGSLDWKVSALGFGIMRLPVIGGDQAKIDETESIKMIRYALDNGVNYMDSAYLYHMGQSEVLIGKVLKDGYRQKVKIATKMPIRIVEKADDFDRIFNEQMERLDIDKIDFYLLHSLNKEYWDKMKGFNYLKWAERQVAKGYIGRLGFSFHDNFNAFKYIIDDYDNWVLAQIQYNYMDEHEQASRQGVEYAASKGLAIVVMEPLRGGKLAKDPPPEPVRETLAKAKKKMRGVEWALQWIWNQPEISVVLSGMSTMEQVKENIEIAGRSKPGIYKAADQKVIKDIASAYRSLTRIPCTGCNYCQPCPNNVAIPDVFKIYNEAFMYDDIKGGQFGYGNSFGIPLDRRADKCTRCEECLAKCPQTINIPDWLEKAHETLYVENPPQLPETTYKNKKK